MKSIAPGKIIFSGEHAVVYGKPALVMAVNRYSTTSIKKNVLSNVSFTITHGCNTSRLIYAADELSSLYYRLRLRYENFLENKLVISEVMENALELIPFAFSMILQENKIKLAKGMDVQVSIDVPLGCGMGSSAATALSVLHATAVYCDVDADRNNYYDYAMRCEQLCHGTPSGVDPFISLYGGFIHFQKGKKEPLPLPKTHFSLVLTGKPASSTGECVMSVKKKFATSQIWNDFEHVTVRLQHALKENDIKLIYDGVRGNHQLLKEIDVVPQKVQNFIADIEKQNGAGKISGAGSVAGDNAGVVLVLSETEPKDLCTRYGYELLPIETDAHGLRLI